MIRILAISGSLRRFDHRCGSAEGILPNGPRGAYRLENGADNGIDPLFVACRHGCFQRSFATISDGKLSHHSVRIDAQCPFGHGRGCFGGGEACSGNTGGAALCLGKKLPIGDV